MTEVTNRSALVEAVGAEFASDVAPDRVPAFAFASRVLPAFALIRALFSQNAVDTCLKLMLLFELSRLPGRSAIERIRSAASFRAAEGVDALVRSLREGGWLKLRAHDQTYTLSPAGLQLLQVLAAADFGRINPANVLKRTARSAEFAARLQDGDIDVTGVILDQLLVLLEDQVDEAREVLLRGRPFQLIAWSRRQHRDQLDTIAEVLAFLQERIDESSRHFLSIVRLHQAMSGVVQQQLGVHQRLREWNLERLYANDSGYSVPELVEAVLGSADDDLERLLTERVVGAYAPPPTLSTEEVIARFTRARKRRRHADRYEYAPPPPTPAQAHDVARIDPSLALARRIAALTEGMAASDALPVEGWVQADVLPDAAWDMAQLSRLRATGDRIDLEAGRAVEVEHEAPIDALARDGALVRALVDAGWVRRVGNAAVSPVVLRVAPVRGEEQPDG